MKMISKKVLASAIATSAIALSALAPMANAEVAASVGVVSDYYFRGQNLGDAGAYGSVEYSASGFTVGTWWIQDGTAGNDGVENDWYVSYGGGSDSFNWNVGYNRYEYTYTGDFEHEAYVGLGFGAFSINFVAGEDEDKDLPIWVDGVITGAADFTDDYTVISAGLELGAFSVTAGRYDADAGGEYDWAELSVGGDIIEGVSASLNIGKAFVSGVDTDGYMYLDVSKSF